MRHYYVYILSSPSRTLYVGITNNLERRLAQHRQKLKPSFTAKYNVTRLVHFEQAEYIYTAISREKQIKAWSRSKKVALIESRNPKWDDLSLGWYGDSSSLRSSE